MKLQLVRGVSPFINSIQKHLVVLKLRDKLNKYKNY